jgi:hypothetical protein
LQEALLGNLKQISGEQFMTKEKIYPNYRIIYTYLPGSKSISYRLQRAEDTGALQFMYFNSAKEAESYFKEVL